LTLVLAATSCTSSKLISITSVPDGAKIQITADQKGPRNLTVGETPTTHEFVFKSDSMDNGPSTYDVVIAKDGYKPETLTIKKDSQDSVDVKLVMKKVRKTISITSEPAGADVQITADQNGPSNLSVGKTPTTHEFLFGAVSTEGPSMYNVLVTMEGYIDGKLKIKKDSQDSLKVKLNPKEIRRTISIISEPAGAEVQITADQKGPSKLSLGKTPITHDFVFGTVSKYGPSKYNMVFTKENYKDVKLTIKKAGSKDSLKVKLNPKEVIEMSGYKTVISDKGYIIEPYKSRSWFKDVEHGVASATNILNLEHDQSILGMTISPDGKNIVFSLGEKFQEEKNVEKIGEKIKDEKENEKLIANIRSVKAEGGKITRVTSGQWVDVNPAYLVDDMSLVFNSNRIRKDRSDIFRIADNRLSGIALIRHTSEGFNYNPSAGKNIVIYTYKPTYQGKIAGTEHICSIGNEDAFPTQLREGSMPAVSPDGTTIAFIGSDNQLWKMPLNGKNPVQLTNTPVNLSGKRNPVWSPDGKYIVFSADDSKDSKNFSNYNIWLIHTNGHSLRQLTTNGSLDDFPVVSGDQKFIFFVSNRGFQEGIWRIPFPEFKK